VLGPASCSSWRIGTYVGGNLAWSSEMEPTFRLFRVTALRRIEGAPAVSESLAQEASRGVRGKPWLHGARRRAAPMTNGPDLVAVMKRV
jgi:hypothetical protein